MLNQQKIFTNTPCVDLETTNDYVTSPINHRQQPNLPSLPFTTNPSLTVLGLPSDF